ncbi:unnamed protein product [Paramecium pentaurelia]|uniref:Uncharacterized protein n=1 Tax=Paramecium pentaurelia TaxID=43138 RepID=A0A8S1XBE4_9CILI|nr:unnamed protein product [Paramecium pentaurelia]
MLKQEKNNLKQEIQQKMRNDRFKREIQFLQLVLCLNSTIKNAAQKSKINFATAKLVLKKFRKFGYIKNQDKDYEKQIELLREIASIKFQIKQEKIQKREQEFKILSDKIKSIENLPRQHESQNKKDINSQLKVLQEELEYQKQIQFELVTSVLQEQIKLMKSNKKYI